MIKQGDYYEYHESRRELEAEPSTTCWDCGERLDEDDDKYTLLLDNVKHIICKDCLIQRQGAE